MAERPTQSPEIPVRTLGGLNERPSKANLRSGEFSALEGLYPSSVGLQSRIPGKVAVDLFSGVVLQIADTLNTNGDVLYQVGENLYASTIDDIQGRTITPDLVYTPIPEEETMSMAIITQREANTVNGGSIQGYISGTDSTAAAVTWYARRLTTLLSDPDGIITTFTAAGSGANTTSFGSFELAPGIYRITAYLTYRNDTTTTSESFAAALWNHTDSVFEKYNGGSDYIVSTIGLGSSVNTFSGPNITLVMEAEWEVLGFNKTFYIMQQASDATAAKNKNCCGTGGPLTSTTTGGINSAAIPFVYAFLKILKVS